MPSCQSMLEEPSTSSSTSHQHAALLDPIPPSKSLLAKWLKRHLHLLQEERGEEQEQSKMLLSNTPLRQLELNGLAILSLGVASVKVGLGAKMLIELTRPSAYHSVPQFPPHSLRPGDLAQIQDHTTITSTQDQGAKSSKSKSKSSGAPTARGSSEPIQGVVFKVTPTSIVIAASSNDKGKHSDRNNIKASNQGKGSNRDAGKSSGQEEKELNLPERCRVIKVANEVTYDRMDQTLLRLARILSLDLEEGEKATNHEATNVKTSKHQSEPIPLPENGPAEANEEGNEENEKEGLTSPGSGDDHLDQIGNERKEESEARDEDSSLNIEGQVSDQLSSPGEIKQHDATSSAEPRKQVEASTLPISSPSVQSTSFQRGPSPLIKTLLGLKAPTFNSDPSLPLQPFNPNLNPIQLASISRMLTSDHFALLHGPPGTGKTTVLAELILQLTLGLKKRVLVCGASNLAVDNLMEKMLEGGGGKGREALKREGMGVTRVGHPARVLPSLLSCTLDTQTSISSEGQLMKDVGKELEKALTSLSPRSSNPSGSSKESKPQPGNKSAKTAPKLSSSAHRARWEEVKLLRAEFRKRERGITSSVLSRAQIVMATCHGAGGRILEKTREESGFDVVIIDEACQAMEAVCWIPILRAKWDGKLILAGDHLQLPPTVKSMKKDKKADKERLKKIKRERKLKRKEAKKKKENETEGDGTETAEDQVEDLESKEKEDKEVQTDGDESEDEDAKSQSEDEEEEDQGATFVPADRVDSPNAPEQSSEQIKNASSKVSRPVLRPPRTLETTLFSRLLALYGVGCKSLLRVQYRMNNEIMSFPNKAMYEDQLLAAESCSRGRLIDLNGFQRQASEGDGDGDGEDLDEEIWNAPLVFYDTTGSEMFESSGDASNSSGNDGSAKNIRSLQSDSKSNANEVTIVIEHLETLLKQGLQPIDIGIIAPYSAQVSLLTSSIRDHFSKNPTPSPSSPSGEASAFDFNNLEIGTVDGLQGREKEAIILTLVRSNQNKEVGFLAERRRLNVAMTRAKKHLVVICDSETVGRATDSGKKERTFLRAWMDELEEKAVLCPVGI